ncbi:hypothetical protein GGU10DRAFT_73528 [Lentinula aff. detonsa]|uniref:Uncharacterized protein n=1 Tax=Lentinula aff. detonsa TaxID=2804958 RepID=A0AA38NP30_9AGAR|nr:hypothetical protein GGU10DRAFT_73528 [Lentinula aff. detonsa]
MAEAKLRALGSQYSANPASADSDIPHRRISHRHSRSTPTVLPIPALSFSSTLSSRTSTAESILTTPVNSVFNGYSPQIHMSEITDNSDDEDSVDTPTPTPSPKTKARTPSRNSSALAGQNLNLSILRKLSLSRSESFSRSLTPPPRAKPSLAMSAEIYPRVDGVSGGRVTAPKPRRASQLTSPMSLTSFSLPASPLHQTTMLPSLQQQRPLSRSEHLLRSALLKDEFAQGSATPSSNSTVNRPTKFHRRRHSHATVSADSPFTQNSINISPLQAAVANLPSSPSGRNTPTPRSRPVSPVHTKSAPVTHTMHTRRSPRSQSYSHALNEASTTTSTRLPLTPHEQVLRARLERVLSAGSVALPPSYQYGNAIRSDDSSSSADDDSLSYTSYHELSREEYGHSSDLRQLRLKKAERKKHRASAPTNESGFLGWLWKSTDLDEEEIPNSMLALPIPARRQAQSQVDGYDVKRNQSNPNSPRTPRTTTLLSALNASPSLSPYRASSPYRTASPQLSPSPSRSRAHTQPLPSSPNRSPYGQGYAYSPKPKHAFSLGTVPSVDREIGMNAVASGSVGQTRVNGKGRMLTPPPTPPRAESALFGEGQVDSPVDLSYHESELQENVDPEESLMRRKKSAATKSAKGQRSLGLGRPGTKDSEDSVSSTSSSLGEAAPSISVNVTLDDNCESIVHDITTTMPSLSPVLSPTSALSTTSSFNARTASLQCRQIDGYISFASIEGLGEPPASAVPTENGDRGSMNGDDREGRKKGLLGRLFGR